MIEPRSDTYKDPFTTLWRGFRLRCPACGEGRLFRGPFGMHPTCSVCGVRYERDEGQWTGAIYINLILTELGFGVLFMVLILFYADWPTWQQIALCVGWTVTFPLIFHRHAKGIFCGIAHLSKGLTTDSPAEPPGQP